MHRNNVDGCGRRTNSHRPGRRCHRRNRKRRGHSATNQTRQRGEIFRFKNKRSNRQAKQLLRHTRRYASFATSLIVSSTISNAASSISLWMVSGGDSLMVEAPHITTATPRFHERRITSEAF